MPVGDCMQTNDRPLTDLMKAIAEGKAQLPDFQRGWVWDDNRIKALILSVIHNYPVGAAMFLSYGNESIHFKHKPIEGSPNQNKDVAPDELILDGQQRLTSLYNALYQSINNEVPGFINSNALLLSIMLYIARTLFTPKPTRENS